MNYPARASKSAMPTESSCFLSGPLVKKPYKTLSEEPSDKIKQTSILRFFLFFLVLLSRPLPVIAPTYEITTFRNDRDFGRKRSEIEQPKASADFLKFPTTQSILRRINIWERFWPPALFKNITQSLLVSSLPSSPSTLLLPLLSPPPPPPPLPPHPLPPLPPPLPTTL